MGAKLEAEAAAHDCCRALRTARPSTSTCHHEPTTSRTRWHLMLLATPQGVLLIVRSA